MKDKHVSINCIYTPKECEDIKTSGSGVNNECQGCPAYKPRTIRRMACKIFKKSILILLLALSFACSRHISEPESGYAEISHIEVTSEADSALFADKVLNHIFELRLEHPYIVFSQAVWESGHFKSAIFLENNNMFGMKFPTNRPTTAIGINRGHAVYESWEMCLVDYAMFQSSYMRGLTREQYFERLSSYAEDENYVHNLRKMHGKWQKRK